MSVVARTLSQLAPIRPSLGELLRELHRGATIYVYDIAGRQVFSQALAAGESYFL